MALTARTYRLLIFLLLVVYLRTVNAAAECSETNLCKIGCCSKDGYCGTTPAHCGSGCKSTCDYKPPPTECSKTKLCATGCCSKDGFCGTTPEHCGSGCQSTCDFKLGCDKNNRCKDGSCCSKFGFCGFGPDFCSTDNCVSGCNAKTFCDPGGYGPEFANHTNCPLNVCCSKYGYCGMTPEFCGNDKIKRPSCSSATDKPIRRVVGYYEGWAPGRSCDRFEPSDIPDGVYTHINFAFASIEPNTLTITPASKNDPEVYRQLIRKKQVDANLKVFIAIGGWAFNDPGPTASTFSNIARSEANQRIFIQSLISFMNTYGFDGVDIDWEYPVATDREGREEDFENLPKFLKNIKDALKQNGLSDGLSIAIPASYWYLQHFDIVKIAAHVDHFNVMTYDLHGSWDTPESWLGNHLNSHTNLTGIEDALDLLWRNQIDPDQVNLGLAFYARTFTVSDPGCMSPGCLFDSGGPKAPCTDAVGVMSNAEILRILSSKATSVELNQAAAVKIVKKGREWMTYDDAETWKLKLDFARRHCLGGAMVWAISQDTSDGRFSKELQSITGYKSRAVTTIKTNFTLPGGYVKEKIVSEASTSITKPQCRWSNCGEVCPSGWSAVRRSDPYYNSVLERMLDGTGCDGNGVRTFCCPPGEQPTCQWLFFNGGKCKPGCPFDSMYEVASTTAGCNNGKAQVACCSGDTPALDIYRRCKWYGKEHECAIDLGTKLCSWDKTLSTAIVSSWDGSGSQICRDSEKRRGERDYCCDASDQTKAHWKNCAWYDNFALGLTPYADREQCNGNCPAGKIKVALQKRENLCKHGTLAFCCDAVAEAPAKDSASKLMDALKSWVSNPTCPNTGKKLPPPAASGSVQGRAVKNHNRPQRRASIGRSASKSSTGDHLKSEHGGKASTKNTDEDSLREALESWVNSPTCFNVRNELSSRATAVKRNQPQPSEAVVRSTLVDIVSNVPSSKSTKPSRKAWDDTVSRKWQHLTASGLSRLFSPFKDLMTPSTESIADAILCNMNEWDEEVKKYEGVSILHCPLHALSAVDSTLLDEENEKVKDDESTTVGTAFDQSPTKSSRRTTLTRRTGGSRDFVVRCGKDEFDVFSESYINGDNGDKLAKANNDYKRYYVNNQGGSCYSSNIGDDGVKDGEKWVSEHILELQTIRNFIEYTISGTIAAKRARGNGVALPAIPNTGTFRLATCPMWKNEFRDGFREWFAAKHSMTPMKLLYTDLGSIADSSDMVNCEAMLNSVKARVWGLKEPMAKDKWDADCARMTKSNSEYAIETLQLVFGVWEYLNHPTVKSKLITVHMAVADFLQEFEELYIKETKALPMDLEGTYWREYMVKHFGRMLDYSKGWVDGRLKKLLDDWRRHYNDLVKRGANGANVADDLLTAVEAISAFKQLQAAVPGTFQFDTELFLRN